MSRHEAVATRPRARRAQRRRSRHVTLLGISYGTYHLANRYLQLFPDGACPAASTTPGGAVDAVALDSFCPPGLCPLSSQDLWEDEVAHQILDLCAADPDCARYFPPDGPSAWQSLGDLYKAVARGDCPLTDYPELDVRRQAR